MLNLFPKTVALAIAFQIALVGCAINSNQLDSLKLMFRLNERSLNSVAWDALWDGGSLSFYVTNTEYESAFLSGSNIRLYFRDFHFTDIVGLLPDDQKVHIEKNGSEFVFLVDGEEIARDFCDEWQVFDSPEQILEAGTLRYVQICYHMNGQNVRLTYQNEIDVDSTMHMSRLKFLIHPDHAAIVLTLSV